MADLKLTENKKIIQICKSYLVTLPHLWMNYFDLKKGDKVEFTISDEDKSLVIRPVK